MKRWVWLLTGLWTGCATGDEPATTAFTTVAPTTAAATATDASMGSGSTDTPDADTNTSSDTAEPEDDTSSTATATTDAGTDAGTGGASTSGEPPSEQPEDGMYSPCDSVVDCVGLTACLAGTDTAGQPLDSFCTLGPCDAPLAQCDPTPGGTAVPFCLPARSTGGLGTVCALDCSAGQQCPEGMQCRPLADASICS